MTAAPLRCPSCGAPADEDAGSCAYCGATLAVVGCPECFAHCFAGMRYCPKCGAKVARSEEGAAPITCPDGHGALVTVRIGIITVAECGGCRGLWLDAELFARIIDDQVTRANVLRWHAGSDASLVAPTAAAIHYRPCPRCTKLMNRVNFARVSKVIVDVCKAHGTWFDRDELA
ncbi:MAG: zf-TFIIB domain-containing protein, partial [Gemmatimonadetes bacterium]|nr:zf-TFIIB domain-containing protein [Gemmatimonadota bacterium]